MTQAIIKSSQSVILPQLLQNADEIAQRAFLEFFAAQIRNPNTRRAYMRAVSDFCDGMQNMAGITHISDIEPIHVAAWIEVMGKELSAPTVKLRLAAIRHLFDWMVVRQAIAVNPASSVRGPRHSVRRGKTPVLSAIETRELLNAIDMEKGGDGALRDRALIALMVYSFARIGAALSMRAEDVYVQDRRLWVRLNEKGGKRHEMPCHHNLEEYLHAYIDGCDLNADRKAPLFQTIKRGTGKLSGNAMPQASAWMMVRRRAAKAGIMTEIGNHSFRATGITAYLKNGGTLENAAAMANHSSTRTTQLYDRRSDAITLDEVERVII